MLNTIGLSFYFRNTHNAADHWKEVYITVYQVNMNILEGTASVAGLFSFSMIATTLADCLLFLASRLDPGDLLPSGYWLNSTNESSMSY